MSSKPTCPARTTPEAPEPPNLTTPTSEAHPASPHGMESDGSETRRLTPEWKYVSILYVMTTLRSALRLAPLALVLLAQCNSDDGAGCNLGDLGCKCDSGKCDEGLACSSGVCVSETVSESSDSAESSDSQSSMTTETSESTDTTIGATETGPACDSPNMMCDGNCIDPLSDPSNCGDCGNVCEMALDSGGCVQGTCQPVWSACVDSSNLVLCSDVCQSQGHSGCSTAGCGETQMSVRWWATQNDCETDMFVIQGEPTDCGTLPDFAISDFYRCCCDQN